MKNRCPRCGKKNIDEFHRSFSMRRYLRCTECGCEYHAGVALSDGIICLVFGSIILALGILTAHWQAIVGASVLALPFLAAGVISLKHYSKECVEVNNVESRGFPVVVVTKKPVDPEAVEQISK